MTLPPCSPYGRAHTFTLATNDDNPKGNSMAVCTACNLRIAFEGDTMMLLPAGRIKAYRHIPFNWPCRGTENKPKEPPEPHELKVQPYNQFYGALRLWCANCGRTALIGMHEQHLPIES